MPHYDFIIAGGGLAGLSLALHLINSPLRDRSILIVEREAKDRDDRTWSFWTDRPTLFDNAICRTWQRLHFYNAGWSTTIDLGRYRYATLRGLDFYRYAHQALSAAPHAQLQRGNVTQIEDGEDGVCVTVDDQVLHGDWAFDARYQPGTLKPDATRYHSLKMYFRGWEIETPQPAFDPEAVTFLDFRTPHAEHLRGEMRFVYVLPYSERRALIEFTAFSTNLVHPGECERALQMYLSNTLGLRDYGVIREESGALPLTDQPLPRRLGRRVRAIGAKAGCLKPTTGFAFTRIQREAAAITQSLLAQGDPFGVSADARKYQWYDSTMLHIMQHHGGEIQTIFGELFKRNPLERVLRFLDEDTSLWEDVQIAWTLPRRMCLQAMAETLAMRLPQTLRKT